MFLPTGCQHADNCTGGQVCNHSTGACEAPSYPPLPISIGDTWSYFKGTAEPSTPVQLPPLWAGLAFDDAAWLTGPSGFGFGAAGADCETQRTGGTNLDDMQNPPSTPGYMRLYLRKKFYVADPAAIYGLQLTMYYDDGFVVYLNGQEVARSSLTGTPPPYSTAASSHECSAGETFTIDKSKLVTGVNVIAIQGHNQAIGSSDFVIAPEARGDRAPQSGARPAVKPVAGGWRDRCGSRPRALRRRVRSGRAAPERDVLRP